MILQNKELSDFFCFCFELKNPKHFLHKYKKIHGKVFLLNQFRSHMKIEAILARKKSTKDLTEDSFAFSPLIYKFNVFHYTVIYLLQIRRFCILFSFQLHGLHKIFPFLWGILFIFFPPFHFFPSPVSFFLSGNMWCRLVKGKTSFSFIYLGERGMKRQVNSQKKSGQGVQGWQTILLLIRPIKCWNLTEFSRLPLAKNNQ